MMKHESWQPTSFASRLSLTVILTVAIILLGAAVVANHFARESILREETLLATSALDNAEEHINNVFLTVETAVKNRTDEIKKNLDNSHDEFYRITREIVESNPEIVGSAIAFEPYYYPDEGRYFSPYSYMESGKMLSKQLGNAHYDYHSKEWYMIPLQSKTGQWSEPYRDTGGGEMAMITYSYPLQDAAGRVFAIVTADVSLDWLSDLMLSLKYHDRSYCFMLSKDGTILAHPVKRTVLNETIFDAADQLKNKDLEQIGHEMIEGHSDMKRIFSPHLGHAFIFYKPVARTGWSMAIACSASEFFHNAFKAGLFVAIIIILILILLSYALRKAVSRLTHPLEIFTAAVNEVAQGNLQAKLPKIKTKDEMLKLYGAFRTMQKSITLQMEELKLVNEQKGRIERELQIASNIQKAMLPKIFPPYPDRDDIDIYGQQTPAKAVGGDLYDFYIRDEKLFFCIGDVSGKGIPASLVMAVARSLFRTLSMHEPHPYRIISQINDRMSEDNPQEMFVTLFIGVLDLPTGRLRYCNAGHNPPVIISEMGDTKQKTFLACDSNIPVGVMGGWKFTQQEVSITPGTTLFLYTDGLTEAENKEHHLFGDDRMIEALSVDAGSQGITEQMEKAVHEFTGDAEQSDDLTMLTICYTKPNQNVLFQKDITLKNDVDQIPLLNTYVDEVCEAVDFDMGTTMQMNLALEEAVVNVMNYAYPKGTPGDIHIMAAANDKRLKFIIEDSGMPFDPTIRNEVDTSLSAEERPIGGLGIHLITQLMDSINYERKDNLNVLTLRKKLGKKEGQPI